jgi:hypothetical protein
MTVSRRYTDCLQRDNDNKTTNNLKSNEWKREKRNTVLVSRREHCHCQGTVGSFTILSSTDRKVRGYKISGAEILQSKR